MHGEQFIDTPLAYEILFRESDGPRISHGRVFLDVIIQADCVGDWWEAGVGCERVGLQ